MGTAAHHAFVQIIVLRSMGDDADELVVDLVQAVEYGLRQPKEDTTLGSDDTLSSLSVARQNEFSVLSHRNEL